MKSKRILSVPVVTMLSTAETRPLYLELFRRCQVDRVFLCTPKMPEDMSFELYSHPEVLAENIQFYRNHGMEVGIWISSMGHGEFAGIKEPVKGDITYTSMMGARGDSCAHANCPLDRNFIELMKDTVRGLGRLGPDLIMLDDDFRLNERQYYFGCFCQLHLKKFYELVGEEVPRDQLESLIFTGGKNKYRDAYLTMSGESMMTIAREMRSALDEVNSTIRLGCCMCYDNWDFNGVDAVELAQAFAGQTRPFLRTIGAPYWDANIIDVLDDQRLQQSWLMGQGVEVMSEGDLYPRPRYNVPYRGLELYDLLMIANGQDDGILKYIFDYYTKPDYETGYCERHIAGTQLREETGKLFAGKKALGVWPFQVMHKITDWVLPEDCAENTAKNLMISCRSVSRNLLSKNSIPTAFENSGFPLLLAGENARYVQLSDLSQGAILDANAALILRERGIDTGLLAAEPTEASAEFYEEDGWPISLAMNKGFKALTCADGVRVLSRFQPGNTPSAYLYENTDGLRFMVLGVDLYHRNDSYFFVGDGYANYFNNYFRQAQLVRGIEWLGGKRLPAVCLKNPNLYIYAAEGNGAMGVALLNVFEDEVLHPVIQLNREYRDLRCLNCTGELKGDQVVLSTIQPYGFAAFEVR